ncbi:hypothetical protein F3Y22_tig00111495pilonHSYRG00090 [Hibiscus syriacus]|uniref:Reverse transcriptase Ty1/copia-type domain-containing protein n=1 Tax=Hibiscus syriacus TaxID=106335 RepID=A0A6A2XQK3_HIBSY|nr:hypothetical protein F3Y22_tig00111495pilonHSYRG00090 [Hibiscus syriacus]
MAKRLKHTQNGPNKEHITINSHLCADLPTHGISAPSRYNLTAQHHLSRIPLHQIAFRSQTEIVKLKTQLNRESEMKDLGEAKKIPGIEISRDKKLGRLCLSQKEYLRNVLKRFGMNEKSKPVSTPLAPHFKIGASMYIGLSSTGVTFKSSGFTFSSGGFQGGGDSKDPKDELSPKLSDSPKYSQSISSPTGNDDDDDFDPRGASNSSKIKISDLKLRILHWSQRPEVPNVVDLFGKSLVDDIFHEPAPVPAMNTNSAEVDLFADATFLSAQTESSPRAQGISFDYVELKSASLFSYERKQVDLFASQLAIAPAAPSTVDLFAVTGSVVQQDTMVPMSEPGNAIIVDPFAIVPLNNFNGSSGIFGSLTSHPDSD